MNQKKEMMGHPRYWRFAIFTREIRSPKKKKGKKNDEDVIAEKNKQENAYEPPKIDLEQSDWSCVNHALSNALELAIRNNNGSGIATSIIRYLYSLFCLLNQE